LEREKKELENMPEIELRELAKIYEKRGLTKELAMEVAVALTNHDALGTHARDELGINEITQAKPLQAAFASALSFISGGLLPLLVSILAPVSKMIYFEYVCAIIFLALSGAMAARTGGSSIGKAIIRICFWGTFAMCMSALAGYLFGVRTAV
ncbi:MAG TPA: VIT1/CCC1 transporter family protein, partial [Chitinophagaceae bacterium]|nr:VIT1/CCC1 transporter family protein [Chitinophagaceae bacterium]